MIRKLDEASSELGNLIAHIEMSELQDLKVDGNKYWIDEVLNVIDKVEEVREFLNNLRMDL